MFLAGWGRHHECHFMNFETLNQSLTDEIKFANKEMDEDLETLLNQACQEMYGAESRTNSVVPRRMRLSAKG